MDYRCPVCLDALEDKDVYFNTTPKAGKKSIEYPDSLVCYKCGYWAMDEDENFLTEGAEFIKSAESGKELWHECRSEYQSLTLTDRLLVCILRELKQLNGKK